MKSRQPIVQQSWQAFFCRLSPQRFFPVHMHKKESQATVKKESLYQTAFLDRNLHGVVTKTPSSFYHPMDPHAGCLHLGYFLMSAATKMYYTSLGCLLILLHRLALVVQAKGKEWYFVVSKHSRPRRRLTIF